MIIIAVGGRPTIPPDEEIPGASYGINSDGFFDIEAQPKRVAVVGAGYITVQLAWSVPRFGNRNPRHDQA
jgi:glutathione reductase (NADPH)